MLKEDFKEDWSADIITVKLKCVCLTDRVCVSETDSTWMITWSDTPTGYYDTQRCPRSPANTAGILYTQVTNYAWNLFFLLS